MLTNNVLFEDISSEIELIDIIERNYKITNIIPLNTNDINKLIKKTNETDIYFYHLILEMMKYINT